MLVGELNNPFLNSSFLKSLSRHFVLMLQISTCTYGFIRTAIPRTLLAVASKLLKSLKFFEILVDTHITAQ